MTMLSYTLLRPARIRTRESYVCRDTTHGDYAVIHGPMIVGHYTSQEEAQAMADDINERHAPVVDGEAV
jgi:hypothetical protein